MRDLEEKFLVVQCAWEETFTTKEPQQKKLTNLCRKVHGDIRKGFGKNLCSNVPDGWGHAVHSHSCRSHYEGQEGLPIWHGMKYYTFTGRSMNSLLLHLLCSTSFGVTLPSRMPPSKAGYLDGVAGLIEMRPCSLARYRSAAVRGCISMVGVHNSAGKADGNGLTTGSREIEVGDVFLHNQKLWRDTS